MRLNPPLLALAIGAFGIGVSELAPMGLLPAIAGDLGVSTSSATLLLTAYAIGMLVAAPVVMLTTTKMPRRTLLVSLLAIFTVGNVLAALAPSLMLLVLARVITSFTDIAFFATGSVVAANLVPADKRTGAVATMFLGLAIATIGGVAMTVWVGDNLGWRSLFWDTAAIGAIATGALAFTLPKLPDDTAPTMPAEVRVLGRGPVLIALALTVIAAIAMSAVATHIGEILFDMTGPFVTVMLVLFGLGMTVGYVLSGRAAHPSLGRTLMIILVGLMIVMVIVLMIMKWSIPSDLLILVLGFTSLALIPLQLRVMDAAFGAPNLASALNIVAFNLGGAIGGILGNAAVSAGLGHSWMAWAGAGVAGLVLIIALTVKWPSKRKV